MPGPEFRTFVLAAELEGERLDLALCALLGGPSRARIQECIKDGGVRLDGEVVRRPAQPVQAGQTLEFAAPPSRRARRGAPVQLDFRVVFEDDSLIVVDKPAGMVVHPTSVVRGGTLAELAEARFGPLPPVQGKDRPGIVHRLDAETSGLVVLARTAAAGAALKDQFRERRVEKDYLALVAGDPRFDADWVEAPLVRSRKSPDRISIAAPGEGKPAATYYEVRERFGGAALLAVKPRTGRTHQIRVHLESIDHPVLGDKLYKGRHGRRERLPEGAPPLARHALHAAGLTLHHPATGEPLRFEAPLAEELSRLVEWLRARATSAGS
jgi:23S rRNA pseudouridine1911/1915/1917 synthase